jgi:hypothetical protein
MAAGILKRIVTVFDRRDSLVRLGLLRHSLTRWLTADLPTFLGQNSNYRSDSSGCGSCGVLGSDSPTVHVAGAASAISVRF